MTPTAEPNYFTCTLGQAAQSKSQARLTHDYQTVLRLVESNARRFPNLPAVGFADFTSDSSGDRFLTFGQVSSLSIRATSVLQNALSSSSGHLPAGSTIGLLSTSNLDFILTWLGLLQLGYTAVFLAPQLESRAVQHLCTTLGVRALLVDDSHQKNVTGVDVDILRLSSYHDVQDRGVTELDSAREPAMAYYSHTSGTSSGLPKPIPQPQEGIVGVLPCFPGEDKPATFTTTPLYHGGLPDLLRSWTSSAMIWFFPEGVVPVTASNITKAVSYARESCQVPVGYYTSVPYILQMLYEDTTGMAMLKSMDLVGVGGAPLPSTTGDGLVKAGVHLVSRMGSMECGFLMSSHRVYAHDGEWQYLRPIQDEAYLQFEPRDDGLAELVVRPRWPLRVRTNREDGSYATADLFAPHGTIPNAWRYHSRADSQLTLASGKKFDPAPVEADVLASSSLLRDVLIFGSGRHYPGMILFPASTEMSEETILESVWPVMESVNAQSQSHTRISRPMMVVVRVDPREAALPKSSKGTILRGQAEEQYREQIEGAYNVSEPVSITKTGSREELAQVVLACFSRVLGRNVNPGEDLYRQNVDSMACLQIRAQVGAACFADWKGRLPLNVVYECGTVDRLVDHLEILLGRSEASEGTHHPEQRNRLMLDMVERYSDFSDLDIKSGHRGSQRVFVLTGATGFLGAHILDSIRRQDAADVVYLLVRAKTPEDAHQRVSKTLSKYRLLGLDGVDDPLISRAKVVCVPCDLSKGVSTVVQQELTGQCAASTTTFIHTAWTVNFNLRLPSFEDQVSGTQDLIRLAASCNARFIFISSIASVSSPASTTTQEQLSDDPSDASPMGYAESKWVAERVCTSACEQALAHGSTTSPWLSIIRVGQLCGNESGVWNATEAYPLMLSTEPLVGCLPSLGKQPLDWLPVEVAANAVLQIALLGQMHPSGVSGSGSVSQPPVYHVLNSHNEPGWSQLLAWIAEKHSSLNVVPAAEWVQKLQDKLASTDTGHPSQALLGLWKDAFGQEDAGSVETARRSDAERFDNTLAKESAPALRDLPPLDRGRVLKIWEWVCEAVM